MIRAASEAKLPMLSAEVPRYLMATQPPSAGGVAFASGAVDASRFTRIDTHFGAISI